MNEFKDLGRPPLSAVQLRQAVLDQGGMWQKLDVVAEIGSTNTALAEQARRGAPEGTVLLAERQTAGRGRQGRSWVSPPRAGIEMSVLFRPRYAGSAAYVTDALAELPRSRFGWLPLLAGIALAETVAGLGDLAVELKWPNDLLIGGRKCAGILAELVGGGVVVGIGLNVNLRAEELPGGAYATSLALEGAACTDRELLVAALLRALSQRYRAWSDAGGDPVASGLLTSYRDKCTTLGRTVRVELPGGATLTGVAVDVDTEGQLIVDDEHGRRVAVAAGDVIHVR